MTYLSILAITRNGSQLPPAYLQQLQQGRKDLPTNISNANTSDMLSTLTEASMGMRRTQTTTATSTSQAVQQNMAYDE